MKKVLLDERQLGYLKIAVWTLACVWIVFFFSFSLVLATYFAKIGPGIFGISLWGQTLTFILPIWTVFTSLLTINILASIIYRKLSKTKEEEEKDI